MKKLALMAASSLVAALALFGSVSPAQAAPVADTPIPTIGGYIFVSTSADGKITAGYSGTTGLSIYNSTTESVMSYTALSLGMTSVGEAVVSPDGSTVYILGDNPQVVAVFDVSTASVTSTIPLPFSAWMGAITPDGSTLLVYAKTTQEILKIDLGTSTVSAPLFMGFDYPYQLCVTSDSSTIYLPGYDAGYTSIVDIASLTETGQLIDTDGPLNCVLDAHDTLYIGDYDSGAVRKYASDGSNTVSASGLVQEMFGMGLTCNSVILGDYQNTGYVTLDRTSLATTGSITSPVYTYMMTVDATASMTWVGGYDAATGLQRITETTCPEVGPTPLPNTGIDNTLVTSTIAFASALVLVGGVALLIRRRRAN